MGNEDDHARRSTIARGTIARPASSAVPERVYRVLVRGLRERPEDRHPSMEALANALEQAIAPRQHVRAAVVIGALVAFALAHGTREPTPPPLLFGPPETIARSDDQHLAVTMLPDGRYLRVEHGIVTVVAADGSTSRALATPSGLDPTRARPSRIAGWAEVYAAGTSGCWSGRATDAGARSSTSRTTSSTATWPRPTARGWRSSRCSRHRAGATCRSRGRRGGESSA